MAKNSVRVLANALPAQAPDAGESMHTSVSISKIDNGYIRRESRSGPDSYSCSEVFSREKPSLEGRSAKEGIVGSESLSGAKSALK